MTSLQGGKMEKDGIMYLFDQADEIDISFIEIGDNYDKSGEKPVFIKIEWADGNSASIGLTKEQTEELVEKLQDLIK